ncbi:unnamed protein product [Ilex paraguariensis]|uniref:Uncharacterized protein n=1 Tax=Ilex paraguariensis TaxID=185542 RepID=A0ABC8RDL5_9AQUA
MAGETAGARKKRKAVNGMNKKVVTTQKKKDGEISKSSKGYTGFLNKDAKNYLKPVFVVAHFRIKEIEVSPDFISKMLKVLRLVIIEDIIVFPYKSKEEVPSMETVIETICDAAINCVDENSKIY